MSDIQLDFDSLTLDECEQIEDATGMSIIQVMDMDEITAKTAKVLVWIMRRRQEPGIKIEDCGSMKLVELVDFLAKAMGSTDPKGV